MFLLSNKQIMLFFFQVTYNLLYFTFYFIFVYFSNFSGSKNRGSMDPVHERGPERGPEGGPRFVYTQWRKANTVNNGVLFCFIPIVRIVFK